MKPINTTMKRLLYLLAVSFAFAASGLAQTKTDTIRLEFKHEKSTELIYDFSEKVLQHVEIEWLVDGNFSRFKPADSGMSVVRKTFAEPCSGWSYIYYTHEPEDTYRFILDHYGGFDILVTSKYAVSLDMSGCSALTSLRCGSNNLTSLDVSDCSALTSLYCYSNNLTSLDVSGCSALRRLDCYNNRLTSLDLGDCSALTSLDCRYNRIPLSSLYEYPQLRDLNAYGQSDSITILFNQDFDLSSERVIGQILSTFKVSNAYGNEVPEDFWTENRFVFQFHDPLKYRLVLRNDNNSTDYPAFTWHISVVEEMPANHYTVKVAANNTDWGTASLSGNGSFEEGKSVTITAKPKPGYRFVNWTKKEGSVFSTEAIHTFTVTENLELTAHFAKEGDDVGNESREENGFRVYAQNRVIYLSESSEVQVYNTLGQCLYSGHATAIPMRNSGLYIVKAGNKSYKVIVR